MSNDDPKVKVLRRISLSTEWIEMQKGLQSVCAEYSEKRREYVQARYAVTDANRALKYDLQPRLANHGINGETDWKVSELRDEDGEFSGLLIEIIQRKGRRSRIETEEL